MDPERPSGSGGVAATRDRTWRQPLLLTPEEAAEILRISRAHLYELILSGLIRSIKIGRCRRIPPSALEEFVAAMLAEQCPDVMRT
ncbi:MAG: helix-turn-helix domain-containing protein [Actinobacteria bacterium]|nr:helix-turn-helix domain-containing protein [Actinomycetota bacterium]